MPLNDHFQGPLAARRHWTSFHGAWATYLAEDLNERLAPGFFAEPLVPLAVEIDMAAWDETADQPPRDSTSWSPGPPKVTLPFVLATDVIEVQIIRNEGGPVLAGAVELVSPANKDRPASREAFVSKCASYLHQGVGLAIVDVVTERKANLHDALLARTVPDGATEVSDALYTGAYRPTQRDGVVNLEIWYEPLALGQPLPRVPLWLRRGPCLALMLEETYQRTIVKMRVLGNGS